jgi:hypothetical protein
MGIVRRGRSIGKRLLRRHEQDLDVLWVVSSRSFRITSAESVRLVLRDLLLGIA